MEIITLSLISDSLLIDSEHCLFKKLHSESVSSHLIERSVNNKRKRSLLPLINKVRKALVKKLVSYEDTFVLDSMPVEICKFARAKRIKICKEYEQMSPAFEYCAAQQQTYYGYKLHGVCTMGGVITDFDLLGRSMVDLFAEPIRAELIPSYHIIQKSSMDMGAIGCGISGSGPALFALSDSEELAKKVGLAMVEAFKKNKLNSIAYSSSIHTKPPEIID